ncbi:unnamed protein product [Sphenostylis stenocarpa]|uniref:Uncharacterized protein n=1 Tax=Sphenostylis stenocarpa TaxID=92480 RepID=A0AA86VDQ3_9FABA|nr:unnamed protein product [Sphenostylis stenocarpa]
MAIFHREDGNYCRVYWEVRKVLSTLKVKNQHIIPHIHGDGCFASPTFVQTRCLSLRGNACSQLHRHDNESL